MIKPTVTWSDPGKSDALALEKRLRGMKGAFVTVGVHEDAGSYEGNNAPSVAEVALWNEFGTKGRGGAKSNVAGPAFSNGAIPERSFIRSAIDDNEPLINQWRVELINKIVHEGWTVDKALQALGFRVQVLVQNKIKSDIPPPNAPSVAKAKARKGESQVTLQDTKLLLRSITFKVYP